MSLKELRKKTGFTLIEIIVSLAIFSVVAVIAVGALVRVTSANRQAQAIQSGVNNISFIMDSISREIRTGANVHCITDPFWSYTAGDPVKGTTNCPLTSSGPVIIVFNSANTCVGTSNNVYNLVYAYLFVPNSSNSGATTTIYKAQQKDCSSGIAAFSNGTDFYPITSQSVNITDYQIGVFASPNTSPGANVPYPYSWTYIRLKGYVGTKIKDQSVFDIQTSVSDRNLPQ